MRLKSSNVINPSCAKISKKESYAVSIDVQELLFEFLFRIDLVAKRFKDFFQCIPVNLLFAHRAERVSKRLQHSLVVFFAVVFVHLL